MDTIGMRVERKYTVSEITELIRGVLEGNFTNLSVEGEISNCRPSSTGHLYFTLKDSGAALSAVMFKNSMRSLAFQPKDGMLVHAHGRISVYPQRGSYQIICEVMELAGTGGILLMLEQRKRALAAEGLFDEERKQAIPRFPERVGIVSSPTGAAVRDVLNVLRGFRSLSCRRRFKGPKLRRLSRRGLNRQTACNCATC